MRPSVLVASAAAVGLLALAPARGAAQPSAMLRYHPAVGSRLMTGTDLEFAMTYVGFPSIPDSATAGATLRLAVTERVVGTVDGRYQVRFTYDSARASVRRSDGSRRDAAAPQYANVSVLTIVDGRLRRTPADSATTDSAVALAARARRSGFEIPLPEAAVAAGATWAADAAFALDDLATGGELSGLSRTPLLVRVLARVDSLVARGSDTLAYVAASGSFEPATLPARQGERGATVAVTGAMASSQIWSTAWNAWVSGVMRVRLQLRAAAEGDAGAVEMTVSSVIDGRMQVRR